LGSTSSSVEPLQLSTTASAAAFASIGSPSSSAIDLSDDPVPVIDLVDNTDYGSADEDADGSNDTGNDLGLLILM
jgi:hypothetical protein